MDSYLLKVPKKLTYARTEVYVPLPLVYVVVTVPMEMHTPLLTDTDCPVREETVGLLSPADSCPLALEKFSAQDMDCVEQGLLDVLVMRAGRVAIAVRSLVL